MKACLDTVDKISLRRRTCSTTDQKTGNILSTRKGLIATSDGAWTRNQAFLGRGKASRGESQRGEFNQSRSFDGEDASAGETQPRVSSKRDPMLPENASRVRDGPYQPEPGHMVGLFTPDSGSSGTIHPSARMGSYL